MNGVPATGEPVLAEPETCRSAPEPVPPPPAASAEGTGPMAATVSAATRMVRVLGTMGPSKSATLVEACSEPSTARGIWRNWTLVPGPPPYDRAMPDYAIVNFQDIDNAVGDRLPGLEGRFSRKFLDS